MAKKRKKKAIAAHPEDPQLIKVPLVQLKVWVPEPVKVRFDHEAITLHKSNSGYFLALWDMHTDLYLKLLTQLKIDTDKRLRNEEIDKKGTK